MFDKSELKNIALSKTIKYEEENLDDNEIKLFKSHLNLEKGVDYRKLLYVSHVKKRFITFTNTNHCMIFVKSCCSEK